MTKNLTTFLASIGIGFLVGTFFYVSRRNKKAYSKPTKSYKRKLGPICNHNNDYVLSDSDIDIVKKDNDKEELIVKKEEPEQENSSSWAIGLGDYI